MGAALPRNPAGAGLPWWWPKDLAAPQPRAPPLVDRPPPLQESDWEMRFSTQVRFCDFFVTFT